MFLKLPYTSVKFVEDRFSELYGENFEYQSERYNSAFEKFKKIYNEKSAYIASSSGRVELLGNHTDHNGGRVLSCAVSLDILSFFMPTNDGIIRVLSEGYNEIIIDLSVLDDKNVKKGTTEALILGIIKGFIDRKYNIGGFKAYITSTVLNGSGVSSSAAFEVLICEILNFLYNEDKISAEQKAIISQFSEREYFGKPCGLLDQTAIAYGGLKKLDFSDKSHIMVSAINGDLSKYTLVLINTGGSHANLTEEYASIPREMKEVAAEFKKERLIEVDEKDFYDPIKLKNLSDRAIGRAVHFFNENRRVDEAELALNNNEYENFLACVKSSGESSMCKLQNCYVAGGNEQLIPRAINICERFLNGGACRVHGGGFAGTVLSIVKNEDANEFIKNLSAFYGSENIIKLKVRNCGAIVL